MLANTPPTVEQECVAFGRVAVAYWAVALLNTPAGVAIGCVALGLDGRGDAVGCQRRIASAKVPTPRAAYLIAAPPLCLCESPPFGRTVAAYHSKTLAGMFKLLHSTHPSLPHPSACAG